MLVFVFFSGGGGRGGEGVCKEGGRRRGVGWGLEAVGGGVVNACLREPNVDMFPESGEEGQRGGGGGGGEKET